MNGQFQKAWAGLQGWWAAMVPARRRMLLVSVGVLLAMASLSVWWTSRTDWRTLFNGLEMRDAAQMQQQLSAAGITYQTTPDGAGIEVPAEMLDKARVAVAAKGMPQSGRLGFELFDKPNWIGSEFDEKVNYQRALEGELEHTIETLDAVRSARVHIVLPRQGAFASEDQPAKASVVLKLRRRDLPREQSDSIRNLVASAVEGLRPDAVTLVDADGRTDFSSESASNTNRDAEIALEQKLITVLEPLAGTGNVHATVTVSYLQRSEERTDEVYDPAGQVAVQTQRSDQAATSTKPGGVAGAQSNAPVAVPAANNAASAANDPNKPAAANGSTITQGSGPQQQMHEENNSYAVTRHLLHTEEAPGRVRRVTAAIVVNDRELIQGQGSRQKTFWQHRSPDEMKRLEQLAQAAVGFDSSRGDEVVLENVPFESNANTTAQSGLNHLATQAGDLLRAQPTFVRSLGTGFAVLLFGVLVLRPLTARTLDLMSNPLVAAGSPAGAMLASRDVKDAAKPAVPTHLSEQTVFDRVRAQIQSEPHGSTRLLESWIGSGGEEGE